MELNRQLARVKKARDEEEGNNWVNHKYALNLLRAHKGIKETTVAETTKVQRRKKKQTTVQAKPAYVKMVKIKEVAYESDEDTEVEDEEKKVTAKVVEPDSEQDGTNGGDGGSESSKDEGAVVQNEEIPEKSSSDDDGKSSGSDED